MGKDLSDANKDTENIQALHLPHTLNPVAGTAGEDATEMQNLKEDKRASVCINKPSPGQSDSSAET